MWRILDLKEGHYVHSVHLKNPITWEYYFILSWYEQSCLDTMYKWLKDAYGFDIPLIDTKQQMIEIIMKDIESHIFGIYCDDFLLYLQDCIIENQYSFPTKQKPTTITDPKSGIRLLVGKVTVIISPLTA